MGTIADSLFNVLMSWVRARVNSLWALFSAEGTTALEFLSKNWLMIAVVMIAAGLVIDWIIWLLRWQPYHLWAQRVRRLLRMEEPEEEEEAPARAHAAMMPEKRYMRPQADEAPAAPLYLQREDEAQDAYGQAIYEAEQERLAQEAYEAEQTRLAQEAYEAEQARLAQEAYETEQARLAQEAYEAEQARLAQEAYEAEQERLVQEAYEAEQARLAQEAYEAEQARLAQAEYEQQMAEYERQKAQYERDLAEYERQKAAYEAQLAAQQEAETAGASRRRRAARKAEYASSETAEELMDATQIVRPVKAAAMKPQKSPKKEAPKRDERKRDDKGILGRVAHMIEPEEEELVARRTLPPRVDMNDAFRTAKLPVVTPPKGAKRRK